MKARIAQIIQSHAVFTCPPQALEFCFSARTTRDHEAARQALSAFTEAPLHPGLEETLDLQAALWSAGLVRAAGAIDTYIAAFAVVNELTLLHYDRDFEHLAAVWPPLRHQWVAPRGSLP